MTGPLIAIIDDDEALCSSLVDLMRSIGYRAEPCYSAEMFLTSASLLNSQCGMPGMGGLDLVRKLDEQGVVTPVIFITALASRHLGDEAISVDAYSLLRKPFKTNLLLDLIERSLLGEHALR